VRDYQKRITATFLKNCSPDKAYDWLSDSAKSIEGTKLGFSRKSELQHEHRVLEYLLMRRRHALIDLGLAQYARTPHVLRTVFARGGSGIHCAVLANPFFFYSGWLSEGAVVNLVTVVQRGNRREVEALALNPHLPDSFYENLIKRTKYFADLDDRTYKFMLYRLGDNLRLSASYDDTYLDGYQDYKFHTVFTAAWELTTTVPTTQEWAGILAQLLHKTQPPVGFKEVAQVIERWRIDPLRKDDDSYYNPGYGFDLRSRLADLLEADDQLLNTPDSALRHSFFRRFSPRKYKNWPDFLEKHGEEFVQEAMQNNALWKSSEEREKLKQVAWASPDPRSDMMMPNVFRAREKSLLEQHPDWFQAEDDEYSNDPNVVARRSEKLLKSIAERLEALSMEEEPKRKWWK
jgi:hypothetical protein